MNQYIPKTFGSMFGSILLDIVAIVSVILDDFSTYVYNLIKQKYTPLK